MKMRYLLLFTVAFIAVSVLTGEDKEGATALLTSQGYTDIKITGQNFFGCGRGDWYKTGFQAKTVTGQTISGTVCGGLFFKGQTIRFN